MAFTPMGLRAVLDMDEFNKGQKEYNADLKDLQKRTKKTGGLLSGALRGVASVAGGMLAAQGIGALIRGVKDLAIEAQALPGVAAAFEGIGGSLERMREGSLGMVADIDLMKSYNQAAQLVSKDFADQLPDAMQYLSKVSAATGESMDFMIDSMVKGVGRLSPAILDNLGIQVNLTEANEAYAKELGKTVKEMSKAEQQTAVMNATMAALAKNTASMPAVTGTAAQSLGILGAQMSNIKLAFGQAALSVANLFLAPLARFVNNVGPKVVDMLNSFSKRVQMFGDVVGYAGKVLRTIWNQVALFASNVWSWVASMTGLGARVSKFLDPIREKLEPIGKVIAWVRENWDRLKDVVEDFFTYVGTATDVFKPLRDTLESLGVSSDVANQIAMIGDAVQQAMRALARGEGPVRAIGTALFASGAVSEDFILQFYEMADRIGKVIGSIKEYVGTLGEAFQTGGFAGLASQLGSDLAQALSGAWEYISTNAPVWAATIWTKVQELLGMAWEYISTNAPVIAQAVWEKLSAAFTAVWEYISANAPVMAQTIWTKLQTVFAAAWEFITTNAVPIATAIWAKLQEVFNAAWEFITTEGPTIAQNIADKITSVFAQVGPLLQSIGIELPQPIIDLFNKVTEWVASGSLKQFAIDLGILGIAFVTLKATLAGAQIVTSIGAIIAALNPVTLIIAGIAAAVAVLAIAWNHNWGGIQEKVQAVGEVVGDVLQNTFGGVLAKAQENVQKAGEALKPLWESLGQLWTSLKPVVEVLAKVLGTVLGGAITLLIGVIGGLIQGVTAALPAVINQFKAMVDIVTGFIDLLANAIKLLVGIVQGDSEAIKDAWLGMQEAAERIFAGMVDFITSAVEGLVSFVTETISGLVDSVVGFFTSIYDKLVGHSIVDDIVQGIKDGFSTLAADLIGIGADMMNGFISGVSSKAQEIKDAATGAVTGAVDSIKSFLGIASDSTMMIDIAHSTINGFVNPIYDARGTFIAAGESVGESLALGTGKGAPAIQGAVGDVLSIFDSMVNWIIRFATQVSSTVSGIYDVGELFEDMAEGIKDLSAAFVGMAEAITAFTTGGITTEDVEKYLNQYASFAEFAHGKMLELYKNLGDKDIKRAENAGERLGNMLDSVFRDLSAVKPGKWDDLTVVLDQVVWLGQTMARKINELVSGEGGIGATTLKYVAEWSDYLKEIFTLLGTNLEGVWPSDATNLKQRAIKFVDQLTLMAETLKDKFKGVVGALLMDYRQAATAVGYVRQLTSFMSEMVTVLAKLGEFKEVAGIGDKMERLVTQVEILVTALKEMGLRLDRDGTDAAALVFKSATEVLKFAEAGVNALTKLGAMEEVGDIAGRITRLTENVYEVVDQLVDMAGDLDAEGVEAAEVIFESATEVIAFVRPAVDALVAVAEYKRVDGLGQKMADFRSQISKVVGALGQLAAQFKKDAVVWAAEWAGYAATIVGVIKPAIEALASLDAFERSVGVAEKIASFRGQLSKILAALRDLAYNFQGGIEWAAEWAGYVASIVAVIEPGIDAIGKLGEFERVQNIVDKIQSFRGQLSKIIEELRLLAAHFKGRGIRWAAEFSEYAGRTVGVIKPGVDALAALATFQRVEGIAPRIASFRAQLGKVVEELRLLATNFKEKGLPWAAEWANYANTIVGVVKPGIDAIAAIADYVPTASLAPIMTSFREQLTLVIEQIGLMAEEFRDSGIGWAAKFSGDAQAMIGLIQPGIDALKAIVDYAPAGTLAEKAEVLRVDVGKVLREIIKLALEWRGKGVRMATKFAQSVDKLLKFIKPSIEGIIQLVLYKQVDKLPRNVKDWKKDITTFLEAVLDLAKTFKRHLNSMKQFFVDMQELLDGFQGVNDTIAGIADVIIGWGPSMEDAARTMRDMADYAEEIANKAEEVYRWLGGVFDPSFGDMPGNVQGWAAAFADALAALRQAFINEGIIANVFDPIADAMNTINAAMSEFASYVGVFSDMAADMAGLGTQTEGVMYDVRQGFLGIQTPASLLVEKLITEGMLPNWAQFFSDAAAALSPTLAQAFWDAYHALIGYTPPGGAASQANAGTAPKASLIGPASRGWVPAYASPAPMAATAMGQSAISINFNNVTISNDMDLASFSAFLRDQVRDELRR